MTTGQAAVALARRGWRVFPCRGKVPLTKRGCKDATADVAVATEWWRFRPSSDVGIATGHGLLVVDVDGDQGRASLEELQRRYGRLPETLSVETGGGGTHLYFYVVVKLGNTAGRLGAGVDTRCDGGFVIAPPSLHDSGRRYRWVEAEMAVAPAWLVKLLTPPPRPPRSSLPPTPVTGACSAYGQAALEREAAHVASAVEGTRNDVLNRAAFALGQLVAGGELDEELVRDRLIDAALACGLPEYEIAGRSGRGGTLNSGLLDGMQLPRRAPERGA